MATQSNSNGHPFAGMDQQDIIDHIRNSRADLMHMYPNKLMSWGETVMGSDDKDQILDVVTEVVQSFLVYDRQEDQDLPEGRIESNIVDGHITVDEIVDAFRIALLDTLSDE